MTRTTDSRARRGHDGGEDRAPSRTGPRRIAAGTCLTALESRARHPMACGSGGPSEAPERSLRAPAWAPWPAGGLS